MYRSGVGDGNEETGKRKEIAASLPSGVQGLGMGLPDLKSKKKGKQKVSKEYHVEEALDKLREQTRQAVKGLESVTAASKPDDFGKDAMIDDWVKQFEELSGSQVSILALCLPCVFVWRIGFLLNCFEFGFSIDFEFLWHLW